MKEEDKSRLSMVANCGIEFATSVFVGAMIGLGIDRYFDKFPLFLVIFFLFGGIAGYWNVLHYIEITQRKEKGKE